MMVTESEEKPCYCIQGSMIGREEQNGPQVDGINREVAFTLNTVDRHAVYAMTTSSFTQLDEEKSPPLMAWDYKDPPVGGKDEPIYALGRACFDSGLDAHHTMNVHEEESSALLAKEPDAVTASSGYLVRRLTPQECCRLQGFPDSWGVLDWACEEDAELWEQVRKTHAELSGKTYKPCKNKSALWIWYNKLHTDSAEYKMWGNGIALPNAYYVMQGCVDAIKEEAMT